MIVWRKIILQDTERLFLLEIDIAEQEEFTYREMFLTFNSLYNITALFNNTWVCTVSNNIRA
jgi:hypothetical protein